MSLPSPYDLSITVDCLTFDIFITRKNRAQSEETHDERLLHSHSFLELFFCRKGIIHIRTEDGTIALNQGDVLLVPSGFEHQKLRSSEDTDWMTVSFSFHKEGNKSNRLYQEFQRHFEQRSPRLYPSTPSLQERIELLSQATDRSRLRFFALEFVAFLSYLLDSVSTELPLFGNGHASNADRMIRLEHLINGSYMKDLKSEEVAAELFVSVRHLNRIAVSRYGVSFRRALTERRLQAAKEQLKTTTLPIRAIAKAVGFPSESSFWRAFTTQYGITPREYRDQHNI